MRRLTTALMAALVLPLGTMVSGAMIVLDNHEAGVTYTGTWPTSTFSSDRIGPNYQHNNRVQGLTATYAPTLPEAGSYRVEAFWNASPQRGNNVNYTINYDGGSAVEVWSQQANGNQWNDLGSYAFAAGTSGSVVVSSTVSNGEYVIADALRFSSIPGPGDEVALDAVADSYVQGSGGNYGSLTRMLVKNEGANVSWSRKGYMRFDLASLDYFDHTTQLGTARLLLDFVESNVGSSNGDETYEFEVYGLLDGDSGEAWDESLINWGNAPANDTSSHNGMLANATSLGTFSVLGKGIGVHEFTSQELQEFITASALDDLVTIAVVRNTPQNGVGGVGDDYAHAIASRENSASAGPQLLVSQSPEPASLALLGLGALCLRRRYSRA